MRTSVPSRKPRQKPVSFNFFRRLHLQAYGELLKSPSLRSTDQHTQMIAHQIYESLVRGDYSCAVDQAKLLPQQLYEGSREYRIGAQLAALVTKVPFSDPDLDPKGTAYAKFQQAEVDCRESNVSLSPVVGYFHGTRSAGFVPTEDGQRMLTLIERARVHILRAIGNAPPLAAIWNQCRFSSGSAVGITGDLTHLGVKLSNEEWTVTPGCREYATAALAANPYMWEVLFGFPHAQGIEEFRDAVSNRMVDVQGDKISIVEKQADSGRAVAPPPLLNLYVQNGVGDHLRDKLLKVGIDIRTAQKEVNGKLACLGSSCEGMPLATLDLKAASDTICISFVRMMLPPEWFAFLNAIRSPMYSLDGETYHRYEKFAAMGNGFCFSLETLLFWALIQAVYDLNVTPDRTCAVYGDDIIVYQSAALELIELLNVCGFETNSDKSFVHGPFRESCGQDYYDGVFVRPVYIRRIFTEWTHVFHLVNMLQRRGFSHLASELRDWIPERFKYYRNYPGPTDTALEVPDDVFLAAPNNRVRWNRFTQSFMHKELLTNPVMDRAKYDDNRVGMLSVVMGARSDSHGSPTYTYRRRTTITARWVNCEPCELGKAIPAPPPLHRGVRVETWFKHTARREAPELAR